ncbi:MAG: cyclase family protein [bacterium]|nr:cyclase family protein [bacterium]
MKLIDLTHTFTDHMPIYPGDPKPTLVQITELFKDGFVDHELKIGMHVGTHMDAPLHMIEGGKKLSDYEVDKFFGPGVLIDARDKSEISEELLVDLEINPGSIVLVLTGFSQKFGVSEEYFENYPTFTEGFATKLLELGVSMVGTDTPSPDKEPFALHKILLQKEILIIENLTNLESLLKVSDFQVIALPVKLDTEAAPARVVAQIL